MATKPKSEPEKQKPTISLRLDDSVILEFKLEATKRNLRQNQLFLEMWKSYKERHK